MDFNEIFEILKRRKYQHFPSSNNDAVDIIVKAYLDGNIDKEEKEMLLNFV